MPLVKFITLVVCDSANLVKIKDKKNNFAKKEPYVLAAFLIFALFVIVYFFSPAFLSKKHMVSILEQVPEEILAKSFLDMEPKANHIETPDSVKGIYMTSCVAGTVNFRNDLVELIRRTELNSVVIDVKDYTGTLSFVPKSEELKSAVSSRCMAPDMENFIASLHEKNIYVIARVTVFQDPHLAGARSDLAVKRRSDGAMWADKKGLHYIDPGAKDAWDYTVKIAEEAYNIGFDEINFDYIRFPSDGNLSDIMFPHSGTRQKADVLESFFQYLSEKLRSKKIVISADLFGMTATNEDDLNIGQIHERALPHFDYIDHMVYPSHYPTGFNGWKNPNNHPYEIVKYAMVRAVERTVSTSTPVKISGGEPIASTTPQLYVKESYSAKKNRPWLQDFDYGGNYDVAEVRAQIQATYDAGLDSWLLWAPSNRYSEGALLSE